MKKIIEKFLKISTKIILKRQKPQLVVVTGSVGKTSTKEAIYTVLAEKFKTRRSLKNYNNELGVPLTILDEVSPEKSFWGWLKIFLKTIPLISLKNKNYPQILVLEIASDKPGDLKYLMEILPGDLLKVAVLTAVASAHLEFFGSTENILKEKIVPFSYLSKNSFAVVNKDNCLLEKIKPNICSKFITYGLKGKVDVKAEEIKIDERGLGFKFKHKKDSSPFFLKDGISPYQIYPLLAAVSAGICYGMNLREISHGLRKYKILQGRMRKIEGKMGSMIIDDTYNSSPEAARRAIEGLANLPFRKRKIAVLGDMLELGKDSEKLHRQVGEVVARLEIDYLITLGEKAKYIFDEARKTGFPPGQSSQFDDIEKAADFIKNLIKPGDVLLIKGSRAMKMEKIVKKIMAQPKMAKDLLVD